MAAVTAKVGSFDKYSYNGVTVYGTTAHFTIPANAGITGCSVSFTTHAAGGNTADRAFALNGARAHSSGSWAQTGTLDHTLLSTGDNTFRVTLKSTTPGGYTVCWWDISNITLTITYNDVGGGGETRDPGTISISKTSLTAGESLTVSVTGASGGVYRDVYIQKMPSHANILSVTQGHGTGAGSWTVTIPESWCETLSPDDPSFEVRIYMVAYIAGGAGVGNGAKMLTVNVPSSAVPTIGDFTATLNSNGVDASITSYVQNYSKADLAITGAAGALGSTIEAYEITGGGWSGDAASETFGPFAQAGDIAFTATVTDSRGRTATGTVTITVLPYAPAAFSTPEAWRSSDTGVKNERGTYARLKSGVSYSDLDSQNSVTLKGRVYPKGGTVPAYTDMTPDTPWITGGGLLLVTKTYIAQMEVADLISSRVIEFTIPTKKTGISIMAGMQGIAFGKSAEIPGYAEFGWPIYNCPYEVGDILQTLNTSNPEDRWPGTEWEAITGRVLVGLDSTQTEFDTIGETGGEKTHAHTLEDGYAMITTHDGDNNIHLNRKTTEEWTLSRYIGTSNAGGSNSSSTTKGTSLGGSTDAGSSLPPYKVVYMWLRTA